MNIFEDPVGDIVWTRMYSCRDVCETWEYDDDIFTDSVDTILATIFDLLSVHVVPVFLKVWWWCLNNSPTSGTWHKLLSFYQVLYPVSTSRPCCFVVSYAHFDVCLAWYLWHIKISWQCLVPTCRVYTVPRYETIPKLTCWHVVSVLLKIWWSSPRYATISILICRHVMSVLLNRGTQQAEGL